MLDFIGKDVEDVYLLSLSADNFDRGLPLPTLLYGLEPKGIGTSMCESLNSYLHRLADAHLVSLSNIVQLLFLDKNKTPCH